MNSVDHHFIPQFYLRGFRDPHVLDGQEPWRWIVDFEEGTVQRRAPKHVREFNTRQVGFSDRFAFSHTEEGARFALDLRREMKAARRK